MTDDRPKNPIPDLRSADGPPSPVSGPPVYKSQGLQVHQPAPGYLDRIHAIAGALPESEKHNMKSQMVRAATSIVLNIEEGSAGQSDPEQGRFVSMALRSYLETVACLDIAERREFFGGDLIPVRECGHELFARLQAFKRSLGRPRKEDR